MVRRVHGLVAPVSKYTVVSRSGPTGLSKSAIERRSSNCEFRIRRPAFLRAGVGRPPRYRLAALNGRRAPKGARRFRIW